MIHAVARLTGVRRDAAASLPARVRPMLPVVVSITMTGTVVPDAANGMM